MKEKKRYIGLSSTAALSGTVECPEQCKLQPDLTASNKSLYVTNTMKTRNQNQN